MYQFTTTSVINSLLDSNGVTSKFSYSGTTFKVARVGSFKKADIVSVTKRPYYPGVKEVAKVTVPTITAGLVARLEIDVRLSQQTDSEYANTYLYFKKPVVVEVIATANTTNDAAALVAQINGLKDRFGFSYVTATSSGADITLTATNFNQRFFDVKVLKEGNSNNSIIQPEYIDVTAGTFVVTSVGRLGFGDDDWMARRIIRPTAENVRYFGISKDETPVLGGKYTQYTLTLKVQKDPSEGIVAEGYSVTNHVFYVLDSLVAAFDAALASATITVTTSYGGGVIIITAPAATVANSGTLQLTANGAVGTVTWVSSDVDVATVASTGIVTADATEVGPVTITATDSEGTVATFTVTVTT